MFQVFPSQGTETNTFLFLPTFQFAPLCRGDGATIRRFRIVQSIKFPGRPGSGNGIQILPPRAVAISDNSSRVRVFLLIFDSDSMVLC